MNRLAGNRSARHAVFVDRDGTLCRNVPYARRPEQIALLPGAREGTVKLRAVGFKVILITNQSGIARGHFSANDLRRMHAKLQSELAAGGTRLDGIYYCPHHPDDGCRCRKPGTLLVERAAHDYGLDLQASFVIGDRLMDIQLARAFGGSGVLVPGECDPEERRAAEGLAAYLARNFLDAAVWIVRRGSNLGGRAAVRPIGSGPATRHRRRAS